MRINITKGTPDLRVESVCQGALHLPEQLKQNVNVRKSNMSPTSKNGVVKQLPGCRPSRELGLKAFANTFLSTNFTIGNNINNFEKASSSARVPSIRSPKHQSLSRESAKKKARLQYD